MPVDGEHGFSELPAYYSPGYDPEKRKERHVGPPKKFYLTYGFISMFGLTSLAGMTVWLIRVTFRPDEWFGEPAPLSVKE
eukprot:g66723.t1